MGEEMSDTPEIERMLSRSSDLSWLNPFSRRRARPKKQKHTVTLRLNDEQLATYKALGGAVGIRKMLEANKNAAAMAEGKQ